MRTVFVNPERCIGCRQCAFACAVEHSQSRDPFLAVLEDPPPRSRIHVEPGRAFGSAFPNRCRHCSPAPCQQVCPTAAMHRDGGGDLVFVADRKCIACATCAMVCPFDVITFHAAGAGARPVATKCDACPDRRESGRPPACVEACKTGALVFGELNDLIRAGRLRSTGATLASAERSEAPPAQVPASVAAWREWGATATAMAGSRAERM
jgi:carbon-monoxide dehydrogenase iron sulfur subunit